jgi:hypothetical protein
MHRIGIGIRFDGGVLGYNTNLKNTEAKIKQMSVMTIRALLLAPRRYCAPVS